MSKEMANSEWVREFAHGCVYTDDERRLLALADEVDLLRGLLGEVIACMDADDYWQLTEMFPRLLAAKNGSPSEDE